MKQTVNQNCYIMEIKTIAELGIRLTSEEGSYWNHNGAYQQEGDELYDKLVPAQGAAETLHGELIRGINRLFHEYCNNGNCNAAEITYAGERGWWDVDENEDDYDPNEIIDVQIDPYYGKFLSLIETSLVDRIDDAEVESVVERVREIILDANPDTACSIYFSKKNVNAYSRMCDMVIWYVLNTEDRELPKGYDKN